MRRWQLQEAKAKFSELINRAIKKGPQNITVHGRSAAVILSIADYEKLTRKKKSFLQLIKESPLVGVDLDVQRDQSVTRDVDL